MLIPVSPLTTFLTLFPSTRVLVGEDELRYRISNRYAARFFERRADDIILKNALPLVTELEGWGTRSATREWNLVVKVAPEEYLIA